MGHDDAFALHAGVEIESQYRSAAEILLAAILREPHIFAANAHKMHPYWWGETRYRRTAELLFRQFYGPTKQYSAYSVVLPGDGVTESDLLAIQGKHIDTPLELALDVFLPTYRLWVEYRASLLVQSGISQGLEAETIRRNQYEYRQRSCAYLAQVEPDGKALEKWVLEKLDGIEPECVCKPALKTIVRNRHLSGYEPGDFVIIMGRPGMGKTHFLLDEIHHFAKSGARGVFISLDMGRLQIQKRMVGKLTGVNPSSTWLTLNDRELSDLQSAVEYLGKWPVVIIDTVRRLDELVSMIHAEHYQEPIKWIAVDYLQLVQCPTVKNREQEIAAVSMTLKHLGKVLNVPVLAAAQLSRAVETRGGSKRPQLSDLRDSGQIEQDATVVIAPYRAEYYGILEDENGNALTGKAEIVFLKNQRDGLFKPSTVGFDGIRGFFDLESASAGFEQPGRTGLEPVDFSAMRPKDEEDIPF
jgi:hypothetical protein